MIYLGLDLGEVSLGIARSDTGLVATGLDTFRFKKDNYDEAALYISNYIKQEKVDVVVLGFPKHMSNEIGSKAQIAIEFKNKILKHVDVKIVLWDERLTTKQATYLLKQAGLSTKKRSAKKDMLAAVVILQSYLDSRGEI